MHASLLWPQVLRESLSITARKVQFKLTVLEISTFAFHICVVLVPVGVEPDPGHVSVCSQTVMETMGGAVAQGHGCILKMRVWVKVSAPPLDHHRHKVLPILRPLGGTDEAARGRFLYIQEVNKVKHLCSLSL